MPISEYCQFLITIYFSVQDQWLLLFTGNMAAFDMGNPDSVVSPGGVGFDINCGVRLLRTNLMEKDVLPVKVSLNLFINFDICQFFF